MFLIKLYIYIIIFVIVIVLCLIIYLVYNFIINKKGEIILIWYGFI